MNAVRSLVSAVIVFLVMSLVSSGTVSLDKTKVIGVVVSAAALFGYDYLLGCSCEKKEGFSGGECGACGI